MQPRVGDAVDFVPSALVVDAEGRLSHLPGRPKYVTGGIDYINHRHRYFRVLYKMNGFTLHECFKF